VEGADEPEGGGAVGDTGEWGLIYTTRNFSSALLNELLKGNPIIFRGILVALFFVLSSVLIGEYVGAFDLNIGLRALLTLSAGAFLGAILTDVVNQRTYERGVAPKIDAALVRTFDTAIDTGIAFGFFAQSGLSDYRDNIIEILSSALLKVDEIYEKDGEAFPRTRIQVEMLRIKLRFLIQRLRENAPSEEVLEMFHEVATASSAVDKAFTKKNP